MSEISVFAVDGGFFEWKALNGRWELRFPAVVGTAEAALFSINGDDDIILEWPRKVQVGASVLSLSAWARRQQDRLWWQTEDWDSLLKGALSGLCWNSCSVTLVAGLPVSWYGDKDAVREHLLGEHHFQRVGRHRQTVHVVDARVLPQGVGIAMDALMDDAGQVTAKTLFDAPLGVIDIGGGTTNLVATQRLRVLGESRSVEIGGWRAINAMRKVLEAKAPGLRLHDHEVAQVLQGGVAAVGGDVVDLRADAAYILDEFAETLDAEIVSLWGRGALRYQNIYIGGGGSLLIGSRLARRYKQAQLVLNPSFGNARGYFKFGKRIAAAQGAGQ